MNRRQWLMAAAACGSAACGRRPGSGFAGYALVANAGEAVLSAIDLEQFRVLPSIGLPAPATSILPGGEGHSFVLSGEQGQISLIDNTRRLTMTTKLAAKLVDLRSTPDGRGLIALSPDRSELIEIARDLRVKQRISLQTTPERMTTMDPDWVAISGRDSGLLELFSLHSGKRWRHQFPGRIGAMRFRLDGQLLLVANLHQRSITALSVPSLEVVADLPLAMQPENLCMNRDGGQLFVTGSGMDGVAIIFPYRVLQVDETVLAGRDPGFMAASDDPQLLFVGSASGSDICVLSIQTRKVIGLVDVAQRPSFLMITPDDQYALVLDRESDVLGLIRIPAIRLNPAIVRNKSGASLFTMLPVGREPVQAAVIPYRA